MTTRTALRENRSAIAPPNSWNSASGIVYEATTMDRSLVRSLASRIANVSATQTIELPVIDTSRPAKNHRNCRSCSGCATRGLGPDVVAHAPSLPPRPLRPGDDGGVRPRVDAGAPSKIGLRSDADGGVLPAA